MGYDAKTMRETIIKPKLTEMFGVTLASVLLTDATLAGMAGKTEREKIQIMLDKICGDKKVLGMWGAAQTAKQKQEWLKLA